MSNKLPLAFLLTSDAVTLKITDPKNGRMGEIIHQEATNTPECPVQTLGYRVHHILSHKGSGDNLLFDYSDNGVWYSITSNDIIQLVRAATKQLMLEKQVVYHEMVIAHSLRAGGAMALKLHGYNDTTIMKMGRWISPTFLHYIHNQIAHL